MADLYVEKEMIYRMQKSQQNIYKWKKEKHNMENSDNTREISERKIMIDMFKWRGEREEDRTKI